VPFAIWIVWGKNAVARSALASDVSSVTQMGGSARALGTAAQENSASATAANRFAHFRDFIMAPRDRKPIHP
jgi:hypothetical protein